MVKFHIGMMKTTDAALNQREKNLNNTTQLLDDKTTFALQT